MRWSILVQLAVICTCYLPLVVYRLDSLYTCFLNTLLLPYLLFLMVFSPNIIRVCYMPVGNSAGLVLLSCLHRMDQRIEVMQSERVRVYVCMCIKRRDSRLQMSSNLVIQVYSHALDLLFKYCAR